MRSENLWKPCLLVACLVLAYLAAYACLIRTSSIFPGPGHEGPTAFGYVSTDPTWNWVGYYVFWPIHKWASAWTGGSYEYETSDEALAHIRRLLRGTSPGPTTRPERN